MASIGKNSKVTFSYIGKLDNGDVFKNVTEKKPLIIKIGESEIPPTLEQSLLGMSEGESKTVRLSPDEGYGPRQKILLHSVSKKSFGDKIVPKSGMVISLSVEKDGKKHQVPATVIQVLKDSVEVDYNHPLAGHNLTYQVTILKVQND